MPFCSWTAWWSLPRARSPPALKRLKSDRRIGAVGGKLLRAHGRLEAAGGIVWRDGTTLGYLRDASPLAAEANFLRDVDFCSAAFPRVRADLLRRIGALTRQLSWSAAPMPICACASPRQARAWCMIPPPWSLGWGPDRPRLLIPGEARQALFRKHADLLRLHHGADRHVEVFALRPRLREARCSSTRYVFRRAGWSASFVRLE